MAEPFRLYNTLSKQVESFEPLVAGQVSLYVCGMTVYDRPHVGHARSMVTFDMVVRYLRQRGWDVCFVRNFTDVDDKIIARAQETKEEPLALAERYIGAVREDCKGLGLLPPDREPRVSESIPEILSIVDKLVAKGHAYEAQGSVWFDVSSFSDYGKLSGQHVENLQEDAPITSDGKRAPEDFALWKAAKPGEPSWESSYGPGRPGWHIECSAMSAAALGESFDIHGGGLDLVFPHHENEIAQSECAHSKPYARYWMHNGLLCMTGGQKMGKSLGNAYNVEQALQLFPAEAVRLYYLQVHYRSPLPWSADALPNALGLIARLYEAREVAEEIASRAPSRLAPEEEKKLAKELGKDAASVLELATSFEKRFHAAMSDDFNTGKALGIALELARAVNRMANQKQTKKRGGPIAQRALEAFALLPATLGLLSLSSEEFDEEVKEKRLPALAMTRDDVEAALQRRRQAREAKDFDTGDAIRAELEERGIIIMDLPGRTAWRVKAGSDADSHG